MTFVGLCSRPSYLTVGDDRSEEELNELIICFRKLNFFSTLQNRRELVFLFIYKICALVNLHVCSIGKPRRQHGLYPSFMNPLLPSSLNRLLAQSIVLLNMPELNFPKSNRGQLDPCSMLYFQGQ
jgi:hypothetical protein